MTQDFIDHLRGSLEMILQQIGRGDGVTPDRGFKNQPVFCPDVSWDVRDRNGEAAIPVGAGVELAAESEQHLRLTCRDQRFMKSLVARLPFFVDGGRQIGALAVHPRQQMVSRDKLCFPVIVAVLDR